MSNLPEPLIITLPLNKRLRGGPGFGIAPSLNKFWGSRSYHLKAVFKKQIEEEIIYTLLHLKIPPKLFFDYRVDIILHMYFSYKPQDSSNIVVKPYEDALIYRDHSKRHRANLRGIIREDDYRYVRRCFGEAHLDKEAPRRELHIIPVEHLIS